MVSNPITGQFETRMLPPCYEYFVAKQNALDTPSPDPSVVMRNTRSTPYQYCSQQVYPKPQIEPIMRMNKDQDQHPGKKNPQHGSQGPRDRKPPHMDPPDK